MSYIHSAEYSLAFIHYHKCAIHLLSKLENLSGNCFNMGLATLCVDITFLKSKMQVLYGLFSLNQICMHHSLHHDNS